MAAIDFVMPPERRKAPARNSILSWHLVRTALPAVAAEVPLK